jgi:hypothetical protein
MSRRRGLDRAACWGCIRFEHTRELSFFFLFNFYSLLSLTSVRDNLCCSLMSQSFQVLWDYDYLLQKQVLSQISHI